MVNWPNDKKFAFTIVDDTDGGSHSQFASVYDFITSAVSNGQPNGVGLSTAGTSFPVSVYY